MCKIKKQDKEKKKIILSDNAVEFIKEFAFVDLKINNPIDENMLSNIEEYCFECDEELANKELNPDYVFSNEKKCRIAGLVETEIHNALENYIIDYDDLNARLGLK